MNISDNILNFIARRIDSVPHLEALLLFWENPDISWSKEAVSKRVYMSPDQAQAIINDLERHGFILFSEAINGYRYDPHWDEAQIMPQLAAAYRRHLVHVTGLIHNKAASGAVQEFARAFTFKRKE